MTTARNIIKFPAQKPTEPKKPRNMTSDGRRCVRVDVGTDPNTGKRIRKAFYGKTLKEAQAKADEFRRLKENGIDVAARDQLMSNWIQTWFETYGQNGTASTIVTRSYNLKVITAGLGHLKLCDVKSIHVQRFADSLSNRASGNVTAIKSLCQRIFHTAIANDLITRDPIVGTTWHGVRNGSHVALSDEHVNLIIDHWREHRMGLLVIVMLYTGMRIGEASALTWDDVDLEARQIHIRHSTTASGDSKGTIIIGKTKTPAGVRTIPILNALYDIIKELPHEDEFVVTPHYTAMSSRVRAVVSFRKYMQKKYDPTFSMKTHDLRHTFATQCYRSDVDIKTAQKLLGHSNARLTMDIYTHIAAERQEQSIAALNEKMGTFGHK